jgi:3-deoxy-D-manno-octulosonic acid kinase
MALPGKGNERIVIRHYRRGGKIQKLTSDLYWGASRPLRELWIGYHAMVKGIPTAEILAACHTRIFWRFHRGDLISREIRNGKDLATYLKSLPRHLTGEKLLQKRKVIEIVGKLIRNMHDVGIFHGDLNLKNIVIQINDSRRIKGYILDFDKSFIKSNLNKNLRIRNLLRLNRSVEKFKATGLPITRTDVIRFLISYYQNPTDFKTLLKDLNQRYKKHVYYHHLGGKILSLLGF